MNDQRDSYNPGCPRVEVGLSICGFCGGSIVDRLIKTMDFIALRNSYTLDQLARAYLEEIVRLHEVPSSVVSDRDTRIYSGF